MAVQMGSGSDTEVTTQTVTTNPDGTQTIVTETPKPEDPNAPTTARDFGLSQTFLDKHPQIKEAVKRALAEGWTQDKFNRYVESQTDFGRNRYASQEIFDIGIVDPAKAPELQKQMADQAVRIRAEANQLGVSLTDSQVSDFSKRIVREGLGNIEVRLLIGKQFEMPTGKSVTGDASILADQLKTIAGDYGITLTATDIEQKVRSGLESGDSPQVWAEGQRNYYRDQAKNLFPSISTQLDNYTVKDILNPYLSAASELLGVDTRQMNLNDERWTKPLSGGVNNTIMDLNEWRTTLRTDDKYGYGKTTKAMNEAVDIGNQIINIMGAV